MRDQSFNVVTLSQMIRKSDFRENPTLAIPENRVAMVTAAVNSAHNLFDGQNPLSRFILKLRHVYRVGSVSDLLVVRKLRKNIQEATQLRQLGRRFIVANLIHLISEGVTYRLYRLDIKSFYESFESSAVQDRLDGLAGLSPLSKKLLRHLMEVYRATGGSGIPRGISLSATLSELMMMDFDSVLRSRSGIHFYARYVDDILIITDAKENVREFLTIVRRGLPNGLTINETKKHICSASRFDRPARKGCHILEFDYLGYHFSVSNPAKATGSNTQRFRTVSIDICAPKLAKIKTRIAKSFLSFSSDGDFQLLYLRMKYLTSNFSVKDANSNINKLAGIYYNYPQITPDTAKGLTVLDHFLRNAILSKNGRIFSKSSTLLTTRQKAALLRLSFARGHANRTFVYFSPQTIRAVQKCWNHA
jgi:hypothetical protein